MRVKDSFGGWKLSPEGGGGNCPLSIGDLSVQDSPKSHPRNILPMVPFDGNACAMVTRLYQQDHSEVCQADISHFVHFPIVFPHFSVRATLHLTQA